MSRFQAASEDHRQRQVEQVEGVFEGGDALGPLVVFEVRRGQVDGRLLVVPDDGHEHRWVDIELTHSCDERRPEAVKPPPWVVDSKGRQIRLVESSRHVFRMPVFGGKQKRKELAARIVLPPLPEIRHEAGFEDGFVERHLAFAVAVLALQGEVVDALLLADVVEPDARQLVGPGSGEGQKKGEPVEMGLAGDGVATPAFRGRRWRRSPRR